MTTTPEPEPSEREALALRAADSLDANYTSVIEAWSDGTLFTTDDLRALATRPTPVVSVERPPGIYILENGAWVTADPYDATPLPDGTRALLSGRLSPTVEQVDDLREAIGEELALGGDASTLVVTVQHWIAALGVTVADTPAADDEGGQVR